MGLGVGGHKVFADEGDVFTGVGLAVLLLLVEEARDELDVEDSVERLGVEGHCSVVLVQAGAEAEEGLLEVGEEAGVALLGHVEEEDGKHFIDRDG